jgi:hypothetical protein
MYRVAKIFLLIFGMLSCGAVCCYADHRLVVLADMGNEPDEMQQMIHMITCSNEFEIEGLIAVTGKYLRPESHKEYRRTLHPELFLEIIDAYETDLPNLKQHAEGWPEPDDLRKIVVSGQTGYGIADVGPNKHSAGSKLLMAAIQKDDPRPLWIVVNAGSNTLAQALLDLRAENTPNRMRQLISRIRVFENGAQDNAGSWICSNFPSLHWIRSNYQTYAYGGPGGNDGQLNVNLGPHYWGEHDYSVEGQLAWQKEHIANHGALGKLYPERRFGGPKGKLGFIEGGGTIPWIGLVNKGLYDIDHPHWGGWGGRFSRHKVADFWSRHLDIMKDEKRDSPFHVYREVSDYWIDSKDGQTYSDNHVPVWRWRKAMYNDQICRMDWCQKPKSEANHHPVATIDGDSSDSILRIHASAGENLTFDASGSTDPDEDELNFRWWIYREAGTFSGTVALAGNDKPEVSFQIPTGASNSQIHLILEISDQSKIASLFDYRRVVIDVEGRILGHKPVQKQ